MEKNQIDFIIEVMQQDVDYSEIDTSKQSRS